MGLLYHVAYRTYVPHHLEGVSLAHVPLPLAAGGALEIDERGQGLKHMGWELGLEIRLSIHMSWA